MTRLQLCIQDPDATDLDSQWPGPDQVPRLWISGVQIATPCATLDQANRTLTFLSGLEKLAGQQRERAAIQVEELRIQQVLQQPGAGTEAEYEQALARECAENSTPRFTVFFHAPRDGGTPRTVWPTGYDMITHYAADGTEHRSLAVAPDIVSAAIGASAFGPVISHRGYDDLEGLLEPGSGGDPAGTP